MYINTAGIVLRETAYKESSKILTVLTSSEGKLTVSARGALRRNSKYAAPTQLLVFSEMTLFSSRDRWTLTEARCIEQFIGLRESIQLLALGSYFAELIEAASDEDSQSPELLPLCLNALYGLSEGIKPPEVVKPAFEIRLMSAAGLTPLLDKCAVCGQEISCRALLDIEGGTVSCYGCSGRSGVEIGKDALSAMRYIAACEPKKLLSFSLSETALHELYRASEEYLLSQFDRRFRTLEYYKSLSEKGGNGVVQ